jgi:hypothetical protein
MNTSTAPTLPYVLLAAIAAEHGFAQCTPGVQVVDVTVTNALGWTIGGR